MLFKLNMDCNNQLIRHHLLNQPCVASLATQSASQNEMTLESQLEDDFYFDDGDGDDGDDIASRSRHPQEEFDPYYHDEYHDQRRPRIERSKKKFFKPPFYADIAGYRPPVGVILNPKDSSFFPGLEPGGLAGITPKFIKFLRGHVKNVGKKKSLP